MSSSGPGSHLAGTLTPRVPRVSLETVAGGRRGRWRSDPRTATEARQRACRHRREERSRRCSQAGDSDRLVFLFFLRDLRRILGVVVGIERRRPLLRCPSCAGTSRRVRVDHADGTEPCRAGSPRPVSFSVLDPTRRRGPVITRPRADGTSAACRGREKAEVLRVETAAARGIEPSCAATIWTA